MHAGRARAAARAAPLAARCRSPLLAGHSMPGKARPACAAHAQHGDRAMGTSASEAVREHIRRRVRRARASGMPSSLAYSVAANTRKPGADTWMTSGRCVSSRHSTRALRPSDSSSVGEL
jgi:hypothetical protein